MSTNHYATLVVLALSAIVVFILHVSVLLIFLIPYLGAREGLL